MHPLCFIKERTRVLLSSIFFMALSVVKGYLTIWKWSSLGSLGALHSRPACQRLSLNHTLLYV